MSSLGQTHYRCGFDIKAGPGNKSEWYDLIRIIRTWTSRRLGKEFQRNDRLFINGGDWKDPIIKKNHAHVRLCSGQGEHEPEYWAIRFEHPCDDFKHRLWITDIGITTLYGDNYPSYRFFLHLYHRITPNYVGPEPTAPFHTTPTVVKTLITSNQFVSMGGCLKLSDEPIDLRVGDGKEFLDLLVNEDRRIPIVLISRRRDTDQPLVNPITLACNLIGNAIVFNCTTCNIEKELEYFLPSDFRCFNGMVRIFYPRVSLTVDDSKRHRFFLPEQIIQSGSDAICDQLTSALTRRARRWIGFGVENIDDVESQIRKYRLRQYLVVSKDVQSKDELLKLYESENATLEEELRKRREYLEDLQLEIEEKSDEIAERGFQVRRAKSETEVALKRARIAEQRLNELQSFSTLPDTIHAVLVKICAMHEDRIESTKSALKSAEDAEYKDIYECWKCLWQIATTLYDLHFLCDISAGEIENRFRALTGYTLVMTEGKQTKADSRLMRLRQVEHNGREYDITPHVKVRSGSFDLRIHYAADRQLRRLVIGHCGDHLETYGTRKRKE